MYYVNRPLRNASCIAHTLSHAQMRQWFVWAIKELISRDGNDDILLLLAAETDGEDQEYDQYLSSLESNQTQINLALGVFVLQHSASVNCVCIKSTDFTQWEHGSHAVVPSLPTIFLVLDLATKHFSPLVPLKKSHGPCVSLPISLSRRLLAKGGME
jgi:hypothetical protein